MPAVVRRIETSLNLSRKIAFMTVVFPTLQRRWERSEHSSYYLQRVRKRYKFCGFLPDIANESNLDLESWIDLHGPDLSTLWGFSRNDGLCAKEEPIILEFEENLVIWPTQDSCAENENIIEHDHPVSTYYDEILIHVWLSYLCMIRIKTILFVGQCIGVTRIIRLGLLILWEQKGTTMNHLTSLVDKLELSHQRSAKGAPAAFAPFLFVHWINGGMRLQSWGTARKQVFVISCGIPSAHKTRRHNILNHQLLLVILCSPTASPLWSYLPWLHQDSWPTASLTLNSMDTCRTMLSMAS